MTTAVEIAKKVLHEVKLQRSIGTLWAYNKKTGGFEPCYMLNIDNEHRFMAEIERWKGSAAQPLPEKIAELLEKYPLYESNPAYESAINET